jgi:hypothetical protein|tara:strand:+ start:86 stop:328 length:243 start_codon:yes stop_codon:yes gene_type:complete
MSRVLELPYIGAGLVCLLVVALVVITQRGGDIEGFLDKSRVYKSGMQTMRKCKRDATRFAKEKMKNIKSNTKRYIRKHRI